jgi:hypothetical protein
MRIGKWVLLGGFLGLLLAVSLASAQMTLDTESRLRALEEELQKLKGEQEEMQKDALAARDAAAVISWRPGRGMNIRGADRSWAFNFSWILQTHTAFFPDDDARSGCGTTVSRSPTISTTTGSPGPGGRLQSRDSARIECDGGPGQGSTKLRRLRPIWTVSWDDGLYSIGTFLSLEAAPSVRFLGGGGKINFSKFSPYYPNVNLLGIQAMHNPRGTRLSSSSGLGLDRDMLVGSILTSGSGKGYGLEWNDIPLGMGKIDVLDINVNTGPQFSSKTSTDPIDRKGYTASITYNPFSEVKGSVLQGLDVGVGYFFAPLDIKRARGLRPIRPVGITSRNNEVDIWNLGADGDWTWIAPNMGYRYGKYRFEASYDRTKMERKFTGDAIDTAGGAPANCTVTSTSSPGNRVDCGPNKALVAPGDVGDAKIRSFVIRNGWFFWGDERRGLRLSHTFNRVDFDAGRGFGVENDFPAMRRYHVVQNSVLLRWFQKANTIWSLNFDHYDFNNMACIKSDCSDRDDASPKEVQRRLGIGNNGGTYNEIIFAFHWGF